MAQDKTKIPFKDIFKVHLLNERGLTQKIYVFCRNTLNPIDPNELNQIFSNVENDKI
jgi:hypothetical protein